MKPTRTCSVPDCDSPHFTRGWCRSHYEANRVYTPKQLARRRWRAMIARCTDPTHPAWANYGGRGIRVCDEWLDFETYYRDTGDRPEGMSLDRVDNDGNYTPSNVRWATPAEQRANRRRDPMRDKTQCPQGHPYSGDNLYAAPDGRRHCRECRRGHERNRRNQIPSTSTDAEVRTTPRRSSSK